MYGFFDVNDTASASFDVDGILSISVDVDSKASMNAVFLIISFVAISW